jgi:hypothetical protein
LRWHVTLSYAPLAPGLDAIASCDPMFADRLGKSSKGLIAISGRAAAPLPDGGA